MELAPSRQTFAHSFPIGHALARQTGHKQHSRVISSRILRSFLAYRTPNLVAWERSCYLVTSPDVVSCLRKGPRNRRPRWADKQPNPIAPFSDPIPNAYPIIYIPPALTAFYDLICVVVLLFGRYVTLPPLSPCNKPIASFLGSLPSLMRKVATTLSSSLDVISNHTAQQHSFHLHAHHPIPMIYQCVWLKLW